MASYALATGTFSTVGRLNEIRIRPSVTLLPEGKVLIAGDNRLSDARRPIPSNTVEVFDSATGTSSTPTPMSEGRLRHAAVALADGRVLLAGGGTGVNRDHSTVSADLLVAERVRPAPPATLKTPAPTCCKRGKVDPAGFEPATQAL
jgi:hypothetical protein